MIVINSWERKGYLGLVHAVWMYFIAKRLWVFYSPCCTINNLSLLKCADRLFFFLRSWRQPSEWLSDSKVSFWGGREDLFSSVSQLQVNPNTVAVLTGILLLLEYSFPAGLFLFCTRCDPCLSNLGDDWLLDCIALFSVHCSASQFTCHMASSSQKSNCTSNLCPRTREGSTLFTKYVTKHCDPTH